MAQLIWTSSALRDVQRLHKFLASQSPDVATKAIKAIRAGMKTVEWQPGVGRPVEEMAPAFHDWLIDFGASGYIVRYFFDGEKAIVVAVRHQREAGFNL